MLVLEDYAESEINTAVITSELNEDCERKRGRDNKMRQRERHSVQCFNVPTYKEINADY